MKVTAIIDDAIIRDAIKYSKATTITDALKVALEEYISLQKLKHLGQQVKAQPLQFRSSAQEIREVNRKQ